MCSWHQKAVESCSDMDAGIFCHTSSYWVCQSLLLGLSSFSWSHGAAHTKDITPLLLDSSVESFLSSFHIDHMIWPIKTQDVGKYGLDNSNHHIFATADHINTIIEFYGPAHKKKGGYLWSALMTIENKIVTGEVVSFSGIMHLPLHWVSVVIDFQQWKSFLVTLWAIRCQNPITRLVNSG